MIDADNRPAVVGQVERPVRPGAEARWYCLDRDGVAMLCKDEADALAQAIENDDCWPARAPHRAARLCDLECLRDGGDFIPLAPLTRQQIDDVMTQHYPLSSLLREEVDAFEACVRDIERLHGIGA